MGNAADEHLREPIRAGLLLLFASVAFVLLIACVNVANLLLARAASRRSEIAVSAALGAGKARLAGQSLTESVLLGLLGGIAGSGSRVLGHPVDAAARAERRPRRRPRSTSVSICGSWLSRRVVAWHRAAVWDAPRVAARASGRQRGPEVRVRTAGGVRRRLRVALVVSEIALASLLLAGAGLTWRSFHTLLRAEPGFTMDGILTSLITLPGARYRGDEKLLTTFDNIEQRFDAIPGVLAVGAISALPLSRNGRTPGCRRSKDVEPTPDAPTRAHPRSVTPDYFRAMGIQAHRGTRVHLCRSKRKSSRRHRQRHDGAPLLARPVGDRPPGRPRRLRMA